MRNLFYSMGWVAVCFMLIGELLPSNGREIGSFIAMECSNVSAIILLKFVSKIELHLGMDGLFCLFSCVSVFAILFAYFCIPDTFGKTLEEIEEHYRNICYGTTKDIGGKRQAKTAINEGFSPDWYVFFQYPIMKCDLSFYKWNEMIEINSILNILIFIFGDYKL